MIRFSVTLVLGINNNNAPLQRLMSFLKLFYRFEQFIYLLSFPMLLIIGNQIQIYLDSGEQPDVTIFDDDPCYWFFLSPLL